MLEFVGVRTSAMETSDDLMMQSMKAVVSTGQPDHQLRRKQDVDKRKEKMEHAKMN